jgi:hypothetical protein
MISVQSYLHTVDNSCHRYVTTALDSRFHPSFHLCSTALRGHFAKPVKSFLIAFGATWDRGSAVPSRGPTSGFRASRGPAGLPGPIHKIVGAPSLRYNRHESLPDKHCQYRGNALKTVESVCFVSNALRLTLDCRMPYPFTPCINSDLPKRSGLLGSEKHLLQLYAP